MKFAPLILLVLCITGTAVSEAMARRPDEGQVVEAFDVAKGTAAIFYVRAEDLTAPPKPDDIGLPCYYETMVVSTNRGLSRGLLGKGVVRSTARSGGALLVCLFASKPPSGLATFFRIDASGCKKLSTLEADCLGSFAREENLYAFSRTGVWTLGKDGAWSKVSIEGPQSGDQWASMDTSGRGYMFADEKLWTWESGFSGKAITATYEGKFSSATLGAKLWMCARAGSDTVVYEWEAKSASLHEVGRIPATYVVEMDADEKGAVLVGITAEQRGRTNRRVFALRNVQGKTVISEVPKMGDKVRFARISGDLVYLCDELGDIIVQELERR